MLSDSAGARARRRTSSRGNSILHARGTAVQKRLPRVDARRLSFHKRAGRTSGGIGRVSAALHVLWIKRRATAACLFRIKNTHALAHRKPSASHARTRRARTRAHASDYDDDGDAASHSTRVRDNGNMLFVTTKLYIFHTMRTRTRARAASTCACMFEAIEVMRRHITSFLRARWHDAYKSIITHPRAKHPRNCVFDSSQGGKLVMIVHTQIVYALTASGFIIHPPMFCGNISNIKLMVSSKVMRRRHSLLQREDFGRHWHRRD